MTYLPFKFGTRVKIVSPDPTAYLRMGTSYIPTVQDQGTVKGSALVKLGKQNRMIVLVIWDNGEQGTYTANALKGANE